MDIDSILSRARELRASDVHISESFELGFRIHGSLTPAPEQPAKEEMRPLILSMMTDAQKKLILGGEDADFAYATPNNLRHRVNVYRYAGGLAATIRLLNDSIPTLASLNLPEAIGALAELPRGLILVTGPTGSGKSTTLAAMINKINLTRDEHILTIEDPIEYMYKRGCATIHQREVGRDVKSFAAALRSALREDPDVILVGEMRDYETISAAVTAAETGHLVLSTLHTTGAAQTIDRIIDACPASTQSQMRVQLSGVLMGVVTQCLLPLKQGGGRTVATEILLATDAVSNMIRENKGHQLSTIMQSGAAAGMHTLNSDLARLVRTGAITKELAISVSNNKKELNEFMI